MLGTSWFAPGEHVPRTLRILVADDYRDGAESLGEVLRQDGYQVQVAHGGAEAIAAFQGFQPDVVFLDLMMPNIDGFATAKALQRQPATQRAFYIAYTGVSTPQVMARCTAAGFDHFLRKPTKLEEIESVLRAVALIRTTSSNQHPS